MSGGVELGVFPVRGTASEADAFRLAIGQPPGGVALPLTFPMRWLAAPEVRAATTGMVPDDVALVHEAQTFEYDAPLLTGEPYALTLVAHRESGPDRLVLAGSVATIDGTRMAWVETVLRLFSMADA